MKQFIYLDDVVLNSLLAQIDEGLLTSFGLTNTTGSQTNQNDDFTGKLSVGISSTKGEVNYSTGTSSSEKEDNSEIQTMILNDYAVDLLINKLGLSSTTTVNESPDGEIVLQEANFTRVDFSELDNLFSNPALKTMMGMDDNINLGDTTGMKQNQIIAARKNAKREQHKTIDSISSLLSLGAAAFPSAALFASEDKTTLAIGKSEKNRLSNAQMQMINGSDIPLKILGIKRSTLDASAANLFDNFSEKNIDIFFRLPEMFQALFFSTLRIVNDGAALVEPIAIFFDVPTQS